MSDPSIPSEHMIETFTGRFVDTKNPHPSQIALEDIAHALANTCRYGGHCQRFYSVAEHAVFVSRRLERQGRGQAVCLGGLHHDDSEFALGDIPRPMKPILGETYKRLTRRMDAAIMEALGFKGTLVEGWVHSQDIKDADNWALLVEARHLLPSKGVNWTAAQERAWGLPERGRIVTPDYWLGGLVPEEAEALYLERHKELIA